MKLGHPSAKNIERDFPHAMHEWHRERGIEAHQGRGQREEGQNFIRWCFTSPKMAPSTSPCRSEASASN
jgi:hypothetical protein